MRRLSKGLWLPLLAVLAAVPLVAASGVAPDAASTTSSAEASGRT